MDVNIVRSQFPALSKEQVFFDNAGGSQILGTVVDSYVPMIASSWLALARDLPHTINVGSGTTSSTRMFSLAPHMPSASRRARFVVDQSLKVKEQSADLEQSYENAYQAAAKYINASRDEIGAS